MAEAAAILVPNSTTDTQSNIASGAYTDIDSTVDSPDGLFVTSVADGWTGGVGTGSAFSFALTDLPAAADNILSVELRARAKVTGRVDDIATYVVDISGTNAPTDAIIFSSSTHSSVTNLTTGQKSSSATAANINGWSIRVYQSGFFQQGGADGITLGIDELEIIVRYNSDTPAGEPSSFTARKAGRIVNNPQIARIPTTQEQWSQYLNEINKAFHNEIGGFEPVLTGFSSDPSDPFCQYQRYGQMVYLEFVFGLGTSDSVNFTITNLPKAITPNVNQRCLVNGIMQDGGVAQSLGSAAVVDSGGTITFRKAMATNDDWTASGNKGFDMPSSEYAGIWYVLRNPDKT
jgi:hypothetical protein